MSITDEAKRARAKAKRAARKAARKVKVAKAKARDARIKEKYPTKIPASDFRKHYKIVDGKITRLPQPPRLPEDQPWTWDSRIKPPEAGQ